MNVIVFLLPFSIYNTFFYYETQQDIANCRSCRNGRGSIKEKGSTVEAGWFDGCSSAVSDLSSPLVIQGMRQKVKLELVVYD